MMRNLLLTLLIRCVDAVKNEKVSLLTLMTEVRWGWSALLSRGPTFKIMDSYSPQEFLQAQLLEWVGLSLLQGSSPNPRDWSQVLIESIFTGAEAQEKPNIATYSSPSFSQGIFLPDPGMEPESVLQQFFTNWTIQGTPKTMSSTNETPTSQNKNVAISLKQIKSNLLPTMLDNDIIPTCLLMKSSCRL